MEIPEPIFELQNLKKLVVDIKSYGDEYRRFIISPKIGRLHGLQDLDIVGTSVYYLPDEIGELSVLEKLNLNCFYLEGLPESIGKLQHLKELHCYGSKNIRSIPDSLGQLINLRILTLASLTPGNIPKVLFKMQFLEKLRLDSNAPQEEIERLKKSLPKTEVSDYKE